jgi:hypothetical protein
MKTKWKVNDWCVFEWNICQITKIEDNWMEVSDGNFSTSGNLNDRLFPLTLRNKAICHNFKYWSDEIHKMRDLNFPEIHNHMVDLFGRCVGTEDKKKIEKIYFELADFVNKIKDLTAQKRSNIVSGVQIFR